MKKNNEIKIPLDVIFLLACGVMMFVLGIVLLFVARGFFPHYQHGIYGLFLIICGLHLQILGKTPVRHTLRTWPVLAFGIIVTIIGLVSIFVPGILGDIPKILVIILYGAGGILLLLNIFLSNDMYQLWKTHGKKVYTHLIYSYATVYIFTSFIVITTIIQIFLEIIHIELFAAFFLLFSINLFYLAYNLQKPGQISTESTIPISHSCMSLRTVMEMQYGFFMLVSGSLLVLKSIGLIPFAYGAQMGTLVLLLGVQALVVGDMLTLQFDRNWLIILIGIIFVSFGTITIIVPDIFIIYLALFISLFNIMGGFYLLYRLLRPRSKSEKELYKPEGNDILILIFLVFLAILTGILMILIGMSLLIFDQMPVLNFAIILAFFGLTLFVLFYVRSIAEKKQLIG
ncbi:hypothetical protein DSECCO2_60180 [anaerobic digester metagenome]